MYVGLHPEFGIDDRTEKATQPPKNKEKEAVESRSDCYWRVELFFHQVSRDLGRNVHASHVG